MSQHEQINSLCAPLNLNAIASLWPRIAGPAIKNEKSYGEFLLALLQSEKMQKDERTRSMYDRISGFPEQKELSTFDLRLATRVLNY